MRRNSPGYLARQQKAKNYVKRTAIQAPQPPRCMSRREGEEWVCPTCALRWEVGEVRPDCPKGNPK